MVLLTFNGEGRNARLMEYKLSTLESLLDQNGMKAEVELTLSVFHLILYGEITEAVFKEQVTFMEQSMNLIKKFICSTTEGYMNTMFLVLCVTLPIRTLSSCYQQRTSVPVDGVEHTMDISWQNDIIIQEEACTIVSTTTQREQLEVVLITTVMDFSLLRLYVDHFLALPTSMVES